MDANSGEPWSEMDIQDLRASLDFGNTYADAARMLCRDEDEVLVVSRIFRTFDQATASVCMSCG